MESLTWVQKPGVRSTLGSPHFLSLSQGEDSGDQMPSGEAPAGTLPLAPVLLPLALQRDRDGGERMLSRDRCAPGGFLCMLVPVVIRSRNKGPSTPL